MIKDIFNKSKQAYEHLKDVVVKTPTSHNLILSEKYQANIYLKREDLQVVRSYKLRGAYNKMRLLSEKENSQICYCASAGNHAQGIAYSCATLNRFAKIYMPIATPTQKVKKVKQYGGKWVEIVLVGDSYDASYDKAIADCEENNGIFIHPFDDKEVVAGQGTVAFEILDKVKEPIDYVFVPIGGGGLVSGIISVFSQLSPQTKIVGVEPKGASSMKESLKRGKIVTLDTIDTFVDGAAVKRVGEIGFELSKSHLHDLLEVAEGSISSTILRMYNEDAIVVEPAGAMSVTALRKYADKIKGKNVVCIVSGGNNDIVRTEEIKERSLIYERLKHYFIIQFPQRPGALRLFLTEILTESEDITYFQYNKKTNREKGPAVIGIELKKREDFEPLIERMKKLNFTFTYLNDKPDLFTHLVG